jgi:hypothetical protein
MGRAEVRGGRKAHNKRIKKRNENLKGLWNRLTKKAYEKHEEWKKEQDANKDTNDQSIPRFNITE